jgi:predicted DsbA family dithiol-disulfide isomerase
MTDDIKRKMKEYHITSVPTTIIDGSIKVVGVPDFPGYVAMSFIKS